MSGKEEFFQLVDEGRLGKNIGLSIGSPKLELYMDGFLPGVSYLFGGASGTGKSTFMLWTMIYQPLIHFLQGDCPDLDPHWLLFNLEMTRSQVYAKLVSMYIFDNFGIQLKFKQIFSRGKDCMLTDDEYDLLRQCEEFLDELDRRIFNYEGVLTEAVYVREVGKVLNKFGRWSGEQYIPNNPNQVLGIGIDHMSLVKASQGRSKKEEMDAISRDSVRFRNVCKIVSPFHVAQFNRGSGSDERLKQDMQDPNQNDFKDSGSLYDDSQVVFAVFSPHKYKRSNYKKYNITILEQCFIAIFLLKSRFGTSDIMVPMGFYGDCSHYAELPKSDEIYDYERYTSPTWLLTDSEPIDVKEEDEPKSNFNFVI
jgi:hypothetical protein